MWTRANGTETFSSEFNGLGQFGRAVYTKAQAHHGFNGIGQLGKVAYT